MKKNSPRTRPPQKEPILSASDLWLPAFFLLFFCVYLSTLGPAFLDDDSPETVTAGATLAIPHPPGYTLSILFTRLFTLVPAGNPCFSAGAGAALWGGLGALLLTLLLWKVLTGVPGAPRATAFFCSTGAGLLLAFSPSYWEEALSPKGGVYLLQSVLLLSFLLVWLQEEGRPHRTLFLGVFLFALGFLNHWQTQLVFTPLLIPFFRKHAPEDFPKTAVSCLGLSFLALSPLLYLPLRAHLHPVLDLGAPDSFPRFLDYCARKVYAVTRESRSWEAFLSDPDWGSRTLYIIRHFLTEGGAAALLLAGLGLFLHRRRGQLLWLGIPFILLTVGLWGLPTPAAAYWHLDDFLIPAVWVLFLFAGLGAFWLAGKFQERSRPALLLLLVLLPLLMGAADLKRRDLKFQTLRYDYGFNLLKSAPRGAVLFAEADEDFFPLYYLRTVRALRPDVKMIPSFTLFEDWGAANAQRLHPELGLDAASQNFPDAIARALYTQSQIVVKNRDRSPITFSYFNGAFHRYYLAQHPALLLRKSGVLLEFDGPLTRKGPWLETSGLRVRHLGEASNRHGSLQGIHQVYGMLGQKP